MARSVLGRFGLSGGRPSAARSRGKDLEPGKAPRPLQPLDPTRPCPIAKLSDDLILCIFDLVQATSPQSVADIVLLHPRFYTQARCVQHRRVVIDLDNGHEVAARHLDLIKRDDLLAAVRELRVVGRSREPNVQCLAWLVAMADGLTGHCSIYWECNCIPKALLQSLRGLCSHIRLHVVARDKDSCDPAVRQLLADLDGCTALVSITLDTAYLKAADRCELLRPLKQLLLTCPNLINLSLNMYWQNRQGSIPPHEHPGLGFSGGEHPLRALESLTIHSYPWGLEDGLGHAFRYPCAGLEWNDWAENLDWSALQRLELTSHPLRPLERFVARALAPKLTALRDLRFTTARDFGGHTSEVFFEQLPSALEAISVSSLTAIGGIAGLARHAPTLRRLTVHQDDDDSSVLSAEALGELLEKVPHLEELGIDMLRADGDWPRGKLDVLSRIPNLRVLEIWFGYGDWVILGPPQPALTASAAQQLFADIRRANPALRELRVHSDSLSSLEFGKHDINYYPYMNASKANFVCRVPDRDDEAAAGEVAVTSLRLSRRLNMRMQRILKGDEKLEYVQGDLLDEKHNNVREDLLALRVALDGPLTHKEWWKVSCEPKWRQLDNRMNRGSWSRLSRLWKR